MKVKQLILLALLSIFTLAAFGCGAKINDTTVADTLRQQFAEQAAKTPPAEDTTLEEAAVASAKIDNEPLQVEDSQLYREVLDRFYTLITTGSPDDDDALEGEAGVREVVMLVGNDDALDAIGYCLKDVSGDGIPELLIGDIADDETRSAGATIYAAYTCVNEKPSLCFEGWARSRYRWMGENRFLYEGSGGAMYSIFSSNTIALDGTKLDCVDCYFTFPKDESFEEIGFYHNNTGNADSIDGSEELDISDEEFWKMEEALGAQTQNLDFVPFSQYSGE